jgi:hypothetical protein
MSIIFFLFRGTICLLGFVSPDFKPYQNSESKNRISTGTIPIRLFPTQFGSATALITHKQIKKILLFKIFKTNCFLGPLSVFFTVKSNSHELAQNNEILCTELKIWYLQMVQTKKGSSFSEK